MLKIPRGPARIGDTGRMAESRLAKQLGARLRPASGAMAGAKGDMEVGRVLLEAKSTTGRSLGLKHEWLGKIAKEARDQGKTPALAISFTTGDGRPILNGQWVCIPLNKWRELTETD